MGVEINLRMKKHIFLLLTVISNIYLNDASKEVHGKIIGGTEAEIGEFPWQVSVRNFLVGISHFCGGSIIDPHWILTVSHCLDGLTPIQYEIVAGQHNIHLPDLHEEVRRVEVGIMHPNYTWNDKEFDIGLVKLNSPLRFSEYIQPINLNNVPEPEPGTLCQATGWGLTQEDSLFLSSTLQKVTVPVVSDTTCTEQFAYLMRQDMVCAGEEGKDACAGDSGGPLVCPLGGGGAPLLTGVTSWGQGCGRPNKPGVYTEVAYFMDWIEKTIASG